MSTPQSVFVAVRHSHLGHGGTFDCKLGEIHAAVSLTDSLAWAVELLSCNLDVEVKVSSAISLEVGIDIKDERD